MCVLRSLRRNKAQKKKTEKQKEKANKGRHAAAEEMRKTKNQEVTRGSKSWRERCKRQDKCIFLPEREKF